MTVFPRSRCSRSWQASPRASSDGVCRRCERTTVKGAGRWLREMFDELIVVTKKTNKTSSSRRSDGRLRRLGRTMELCRAEKTGRGRGWTDDWHQSRQRRAGTKEGTRRTDTQLLGLRSRLTFWQRCPSEKFGRRAGSMHAGRRSTAVWTWLRG
ncbi:hypothetical protein LZ32DRAFT_456213 [Colletotrichum eremochloae]|nr:hypothetical protein LZ32DRAFT_456213 [Colletotrichum eremochloae]